MNEDELDKRDYDLIVPLYLDISALLDVFASLEDGFSLAETQIVRDSTGSTKTSEAFLEAGAKFVTLLKLGVGASKQKTDESKKDTQRSVERFNTYGSLLYTLRSRLNDKDLLKTAKQGLRLEGLEPSDFVEIRGVFRPDPLMESIVNFDRLMELALPIIQIQGQSKIEEMESEIETNVEALEKENASQPKSERHASKKRIDEYKKQQTQYLEGLRKSTTNNLTLIESMRNLFKNIGKDLEHGGVRTFLMNPTDVTEYSVVIPFLKEYSRDLTMTELAHKDLRLFGKVLQNVTEEDEAVDLLQGTGLGIMGDEILNSLFSAFKEMGQSGFEIPEITRYIKSPVLQVLPIAVYI
jgi:hypothetical protein